MARLLVLGSSNTDMTVCLPRLPGPGQTVLGGSLLTGPGGKGANQAVAAARAGGEVVFVTAVGDDPFGRQALDGYRREGIDASHSRIVAGAASGVALILVGDDGENMIGVAPGANAALGPDDIDRLPDYLFGPDRLLLIAGLEVPLQAVERAVRRGSASGMTVVLNPAPAAGGLRTLGVLELVDVITPNHVELGQLIGIDTESDAGLVGAARALLDVGPTAAVVTIGKEGCLVLGRGENERIPSLSVRAVDTVGAGDCFSAALAVGLAEGRALVEAAAWANAAAALAVTRPGAQSALPFRPEIDRLASASRRPV
jgi:ribokinase